MSSHAKLIVTLTIAYILFLVAVHRLTLAQEQRDRAKAGPSETKQEKSARKGKIPDRARRANACLTWEEKWHKVHNRFRPAPAMPSAELTEADRVITQMVLSVNDVITEETVDIPICDLEVLQRLQNSMDMPLRYGYPNDGTCGGGFGCGGAFGVLKVSATDGDFEIGISLAGFLIDADEGPDVRNIFFSWALANELDDIWHNHTGKHFPEDLVKTLSGISWLELQGYVGGMENGQSDRKRGIEE